MTLPIPRQGELPGWLVGYGIRSRRIAHDARGSFYGTWFIPCMPPDLGIELVTRTIGETQLLDEMILRFTHTVDMPWMAPGVAPTGKRVEDPIVAIIGFREDKVSHEHIYRDQASVLN